MKLIPTNYYGNAVRRRKLQNFHVSLTTYADQVEVPKHSHLNPYFSINLGCSYYEIENSSKIIIKPGQVVYRPSNYEHANIFSKKNGVCLNIEITDVNCEFSKMFSRLQFKQSDLMLCKICVAYINNHNTDELDCLIYEYLIQNFDDSCVKRPPSWYFKIVEFINDKFYDQITLTNLSEVADVHPNYISRKFKKINGLNISEYIRKVRIEKAFGLVISDKYNLTQIGFDTGFYDQSHFTRNFKSMLGYNPNQFKSNYKRLISYN